MNVETTKLTTNVWQNVAEDLFCLASQNTGVIGASVSLVPFSSSLHRILQNYRLFVTHSSVALLCPPGTFMLECCLYFTKLVVTLTIKKFEWVIWAGYAKIWVSFSHCTKHHLTNSLFSRNLLEWIGSTDDWDESWIKFTTLTGSPCTFCTHILFN